MRPACYVCLLLTLCAVPALAQPASPAGAAPGSPSQAASSAVPPPALWSIGVDAGYVRHGFAPAYTGLDGASLGSFDNPARGGGIGMLVGYQVVSTGPLAVALAGRVGLSQARWTLDVIDTPGFLGGTVEVPSSLTYSIPFTASLAIQPRVPLGGGVCLEGELGAGLGRIDQRKTSQGGSTYDMARWQPFWEIGAGASVGVGRRVRLYGMYRRAAYRGYAFVSHTPAGAPFETIHDAPRTQAVGGGLSLSFGR